MTLWSEEAARKEKELTELQAAITRWWLQKIIWFLTLGQAEGTSAP